MAPNFTLHTFDLAKKEMKNIFSLGGDAVNHLPYKIASNVHIFQHILRTETYFQFFFRHLEYATRALRYKIETSSPGWLNIEIYNLPNFSW